MLLVPLLPYAPDVGAQGIEALAEELPRGHHRAEPVHEEVQEAVERLPLDGRRVTLELEAGCGRKHLPNVVLRSPQDRRRGEVRRWRQVGGRRAEDVTDGSFRCPAADGDRSPLAGRPP